MTRILSPPWLWPAQHRVVSAYLEEVHPWLIVALKSVVGDSPRYIRKKISINSHRAPPLENLGIGGTILKKI